MAPFARYAFIQILIGLAVVGGICGLIGVSDYNTGLAVVGYVLATVGVPWLIARSRGQQIEWTAPRDS